MRKKSRPNPETRLDVSRQVLLSGVLLFLLAVAVYLPSWRGEFLWDDDSSVTASDVVMRSDGLWKAWINPPKSHPDYFPLTTATYWVEWRLWGANPAGYRVLNILLHGSCAVLLWRLFREMRLPGAWWAAAVFAVHPVNVESVAWIAERKNLLAMVFAIPAFSAFLRWEESGDRKWYWLALGFFFAALAAKASVVTLPLVFLACLWWKRGRPPGTGDLRGVAAFLGLSLFFGLLVTHFQHTRAMVGWEIRMPGLWARFCGAVMACWFYLGKAVWPVDLATIYPQWNFDPPQVWQTLLAGATVLAVVAMWFARRTTWRGLAFGLTAYGLLLAPTLGMIKMSYMKYSLVADHFQHLALPAIVGTVVCGAATLSASRANLRRATDFLFVTVTAMFFVLSWQRAAIHGSHEALWRDAMPKNPASPQPHNVLGSILAGRRRYGEAESHFREAIRLNPDDPYPLANLGLIYYESGRPSESIQWFQKAIALGRDCPDAFINLARAHAKLEDSESSLAVLERGATAYPEDLKLNSAAGATLLVAGRPDQALKYLERCELLDPANARIKQDLSNALRDLGRNKEADSKWREATAIDPSLRSAMP